MTSCTKTKVNGKQVGSNVCYLLLQSPQLRRWDQMMPPSCSVVKNGKESRWKAFRTRYELIRAKDKDNLDTKLKLLSLSHPTARVCWRGGRAAGNGRCGVSCCSSRVSVVAMVFTAAHNPNHIRMCTRNHSQPATLLGLKKGER